MFDLNDNFGVENFTNDFEYIFEDFKVLVKYISKNTNAEDEYVQGDFLGIRTKTFKDKDSYIYIVIESDSSGDQETRDGTTKRSVKQYLCHVKKSDNIKVGDEIEIIQNFGSIERGTRLRIGENPSTKFFQLNPSFRTFKLIRL